MMRLTTLEGVTVIRYFSASPLTSLRLLLCLRILVGSPFAVSVLRLSAIGLRDHPSSLHNNRPLLARSHARTRAFCSRADTKSAQCFRGVTVKCLNCGLPILSFFLASRRRGAQRSLCDAFNGGHVGVEIRETLGLG